jgi:hypothetical protein
MKVAVFAPYGSLHKESGLLFLVANYLAKNGAEVVQLRCDGAVPACGRDRGAGVVRTPFQCVRCMSDQAALAAWAGVTVRDLSSEVVPDDVLTTAQWLQSVAPDALERVEFRGVNLWSACRAELLMRWDSLQPQTLTEAQELDVRGLFISYVRTAVASERFLKKFEPTLALVSSIRDPLCHAFVLQAKQSGLDTAVGWYNPGNETIGIESVATRETYSTALILEGLVSMRSDPRTWGPEITAIVHEALTFLGCAPDRVPEGV